MVRGTPLAEVQRAKAFGKDFPHLGKFLGMPCSKRKGGMTTISFYERVRLPAIYTTTHFTTKH